MSIPVHIIACVPFPAFSCKQPMTKLLLRISISTPPHASSMRRLFSIPCFLIPVKFQDWKLKLYLHKLISVLRSLSPLIRRDFSSITVITGLSTVGVLPSHPVFRMKATGSQDLQKHEGPMPDPHCMTWGQMEGEGKAKPHA